MDLNPPGSGVNIYYDQLRRAMKSHGHTINVSTKTQQAYQK